MAKAETAQVRRLVEQVETGVRLELTLEEAETLRDLTGCGVGWGDEISYALAVLNLSPEGTVAFYPSETSTQKIATIYRRAL